MSLRGAVAALAGDGRELRLAELVVGAGNQIDGIGMAEYASLQDGVREIENAFRFITGCDIPKLRLRVIRGGRLEQERRNRNQVAETDFAGANGVSYGIL